MSSKVSKVALVLSILLIIGGVITAYITIKTLLVPQIDNVYVLTELLKFQ